MKKALTAAALISISYTTMAQLQHPNSKKVEQTDNYFGTSVAY
jgi:hypothetical protein